MNIDMLITMEYYMFCVLKFDFSMLIRLVAAHRKISFVNMVRTILKSFASTVTYRLQYGLPEEFAISFASPNDIWSLYLTNKTPFSYYSLFLLIWFTTLCFKWIWFEERESWGDSRNDDAIWFTTVSSLMDFIETKLVGNEYMTMIYAFHSWAH